VTDFRKFTGRRLADFSAQHMPACFQSVLAERAGDERERRLWQPSASYWALAGKVENDVLLS
jgi:hypothetical protein